MIVNKRLGEIDDEIAAEKKKQTDAIAARKLKDDKRATDEAEATKRAEEEKRAQAAKDRKR